MPVGTTHFIFMWVARRWSRVWRREYRILNTKIQLQLNSIYVGCKELVYNVSTKNLTYGSNWFLNFEFSAAEFKSLWQKSDDEIEIDIEASEYTLDSQLNPRLWNDNAVNTFVEGS